MQRILYVEDDLSLIDGLQYTLEISGYTVDNAKTKKEALVLFKKNTYDLLLLDVTLPDGTGFDVCKEVRNSSTVPIIFLTASDQEISIVRGLDMGADDYITKPFSLSVVRARVDAMLRRAGGADVVLTDGFRFDFAHAAFSKDGEAIVLSRSEQRLLRALVNARGKIVQRETLLDRVWTDGMEYVDENALSVTVRRLRQKLGKAYIQTVYGVGYRWGRGDDK